MTLLGGFERAIFNSCVSCGSASIADQLTLAQLLSSALICTAFEISAAGSQTAIVCCLELQKLSLMNCRIFGMLWRLYVELTRYVLRIDVENTEFTNLSVRN